MHSPLASNPQDVPLDAVKRLYQVRPLLLRQGPWQAQQSPHVAAPPTLHFRWWAALTPGTPLIFNARPPSTPSPLLAAARVWAAAADTGLRAGHDPARQRHHRQQCAAGPGARGAGGRHQPWQGEGPAPGLLGKPEPPGFEQTAAKGGTPPALPVPPKPHRPTPGAPPAVSSITALASTPFTSTYGSTKAALLNMTGSIRWGCGVPGGQGLGGLGTGGGGGVGARWGRGLARAPARSPARPPTQTEHRPLHRHPPPAQAGAGAVWHQRGRRRAGLRAHGARPAREPGRRGCAPGACSPGLLQRALSPNPPAPPSGCPLPHPTPNPHPHPPPPTPTPTPHPPPPPPRRSLIKVWPPAPSTRPTRQARTRRWRGTSRTTSLRAGAARPSSEGWGLGRVVGGVGGGVGTSRTTSSRAGGGGHARQVSPGSGWCCRVFGVGLLGPQPRKVLRKVGPSESGPHTAPLSPPAARPFARRFVSMALSRSPPRLYVTGSW
jgi:hypothetical protein